LESAVFEDEIVVGVEVKPAKEVDWARPVIDSTIRKV
jgi:hypothetical protein